jgi:deazaflavin-dependent oxidoreductase (nitroreductase family)
LPLPRSVALFNKRVANRVVRPIARYAPILAVVHHTGRRTGASYAIPVNVFHEGEDIIIPLTYGSGSDWVRNVLASGRCTLEHKGRMREFDDVRLEVDRAKPWAPAAIRWFLARLDVHEIIRLSGA